MQQEMPGQYFMEGISEANTMGLASGLAADGFIPFVVNHASFGVRRCYEQIVLDACLQERPDPRFTMVFIGDTARRTPRHLTEADVLDIWCYVFRYGI